MRSPKTLDKKLTETEAKVLIFCRDYFLEHGHCPKSPILKEQQLVRDRGKAVQAMYTLIALGYIALPPGKRHFAYGWVTPLGLTLAHTYEIMPVMARRTVRPKKQLGEHPCVKEGRALFSKKVSIPGKTVLRNGRNNSKLGPIVTLGRWRGMPIYSLTLEERKTCPKSCKWWAGCYGNNMPYAVRYRHGPALIAVLNSDLQRLNKRYRNGFVVRLHILGDFYSMDYIKFWEDALTKYPNLHVFGYTAWLPHKTAKGTALYNLAQQQWDRFAVRFSGFPGSPMHSTRVVPMGKPTKLDKATEIICPYDTKKVAGCGTCGLCWATRKRVVFMEH